MNKGALQKGLLAATWGVFLVVAVWRFILTGAILLGAPALNKVFWLQPDEFIPWMVIGLLLLTDAQGVAATTLGRLRLGRILAVLLVLGVALTGIGIAVDEFGGQLDLNSRSPWEYAGLGVMALCAVFISGSQVRAVTAAMRPAPGKGKDPGSGGVTILDLWRFAAGQWTLLMVAALVYMAVTMSRLERLGREDVRHLLFLVPAAGALPGALMAAGIAWWDRIMLAADPAVRAAARPRVRAWMLALLLNCGAGLLLVLRNPWLSAPGAALEAAAMALYLQGFPPLLWRKLGGKLLLIAWGLFGVALGAFAIQRVTAGDTGSLAQFGYTAAWRALWMMAVPLGCLGMGAAALEILAPPAWFARTRRAIGLAGGLLTGGAAVTAGLFLVSASQTQVDVMGWLILGSLPVLAGILGMGAILPRSVRLGR